MRILLAFILWFAFCFSAWNWMASESEPEVKEIELSRHGPERDCGEFTGQPVKFAECYGYE